MRTILVCLLTLGFALSATAQFYPEANARWCGVDDDGGPPNYDVQYQMGVTPDTTINGVNYQKIEEYRDYLFTRTYFVRSDPNGRGFAYLPDSTAEFLTGDLNAQAGDTVHDVLWSNTYQSGVDYFLTDMVVDSVVALSNAGVTVTRQYVSPNVTMLLFWQAGMGTISGPMLELTGASWSCMVGDTAVYNLANDGGLPGPMGVDLCSLISTANGINEPAQVVNLQAWPEPSTGQFIINPLQKSYGITVYTATGQQVWQGSGNTIDLTAQPPGVYTAVVATERGRQAVRLVVVR